MAVTSRVGGGYGPTPNSDEQCVLIIRLAGESSPAGDLLFWNQSAAMTRGYRGPTRLSRGGWSFVSWPDRGRHPSTHGGVVYDGGIGGTGNRYAISTDKYRLSAGGGFTAQIGNWRNNMTSNVSELQRDGGLQPYPHPAISYLDPPQRLSYLEVMENHLHP